MSASSCQVWCHFSLRRSFRAFTRHALVETAPEDSTAKAVAVSWLLFQNSGQLLITYRLRHIKSGHGFNIGTFPFKRLWLPFFTVVEHQKLHHDVCASHLIWTCSQWYILKSDATSKRTCRHLLSSFVILCHVGAVGKKDSGLTMNNQHFNWGKGC